MQSDFQEVFKFFCSYYDHEINEKLVSSEYYLLREKSKKFKSKLLNKTNDKELLDKFTEALRNELSCYYEHASIVVLQHFISMLKKNNLL